MAPSPTLDVFAQSASQSAALHGHKALTPIISGAISGGLVGLAWLVGFIVYFYKRHKRERRALAAGYRGHREMLDPPKKPEPYIIPPDPAVVEGVIAPGGHPLVTPDSDPNFMPHRAFTTPMSKHEATHIDEKKTPSETPPHLDHSVSAPEKQKHSWRSPPAIHSTTIHDRPSTIQPSRR